MTIRPLAEGAARSWNSDSPVITNTKRILREDVPISTFSEDIWDLAAMAPPRQRWGFTCNFDTVPRRFRLSAKKAVWLLINEGKPAHAVRRGGTKTKRWVGVGTITQFLSHIRALLTFVAQETPEVRSLGGIVSETLDTYVGSLERRIDPQSVVLHYGSIRLLHDLTANLPSGERLIAPSWVDDKIFVNRGGHSDSATPPMSLDVLTPMLLWSVAFVEQFADDILSARDAINAYVPATMQHTPMSRQQAMDIVGAWTKNHRDFLPCTDAGGGGIAVSYMCFVLDWPIRFQRSGLSKLLIRHPEIAISKAPCPIPTPVNGKVHGKCWQPEGLDFYRLTAHEVDLQSACLFLVGLNSSMRPDELLNLQFEALQDDGIRKPITERVEAPDGQVRYLLYGRTFKGQDGVDRAQRADGVIRTWAITELGATAVNVLQRLNGRNGRLFASSRMDDKHPPIQSLSTTTAADNLRSFVKRTRSLTAELALPEEYFIPENAEDFMTLRVLRRTSEVLTQQEIGGVLAGAHQAGHRLRDPYDTRVTEGYGGLATQSKLGRRTSDRTGRALAHLVVESREGAIGGPAADRALDVADLAAAELELVDPANLMTPVLSNEWKRITKSVGQAVYEVPLAGGTHAYCIFHLPWSACTKEGEEPDIAGCKIVCANKALTVGSVRGLRQRQHQLEASKQGATTEEIIRADHLIDAYEEQIVDSGLPGTSCKKTRRSTPR